MRAMMASMSSDAAISSRSTCRLTSAVRSTRDTIASMTAGTATSSDAFTGRANGRTARPAVPATALATAVKASVGVTTLSGPGDGGAGLRQRLLLDRLELGRGDRAAVQQLLGLGYLRGAAAAVGGRGGRDRA